MSSHRPSLDPKLQHLFPRQVEVFSFSHNRWMPGVVIGLCVDAGGGYLTAGECGCHTFLQKKCKRFMLHTSWDLIWVCLKIIWYISKITQREMVDFGRVWFSSQQSRHSGHFVFRAINGRQGRSASWLNFVEAQKKNSWFNLFDLFLRFWDLRKGFQVFWIHKMLLALVWMAE